MFATILSVAGALAVGFAAVYSLLYFGAVKATPSDVAWALESGEANIHQIVESLRRRQGVSWWRTIYSVSKAYTSLERMEADGRVTHVPGPRGNYYRLVRR